MHRAILRIRNCLKFSSETKFSSTSGLTSPTRMYYDSQSGKYVAVPGLRGVMIHDMTFEKERHFESQMKSEMMEILELNPTTVSIHMDSIAAFLKTIKPKLSLNCMLDSRADMSRLTDCIDSYQNVSIVFNDKEDLTLASEIMSIPVPIALHMHLPTRLSGLTTLKEVQETIEQVGRAADAGASVIVLDPIDWECDDDVLRDVVEGCFGLDVEGETISERLGILALGSFVSKRPQGSVPIPVEMKILNLVTSSKNPNMLSARQTRELISSTLTNT